MWVMLLGPGPEFGYCQASTSRAFSLVLQFNSPRTLAYFDQGQRGQTPDNHRSFDNLKCMSKHTSAHLYNITASFDFGQIPHHGIAACNSKPDVIRLQLFGSVRS
jgi:hypothetical protein